MDTKTLDELIESSPILKSMHEKFKESQKEELKLIDKVTISLQRAVGGLLRSKMLNTEIDTEELSEFAYEITLEVTRLRLSLEKLRKDHEKLRNAYTIMVDSKLDE